MGFLKILRSRPSEKRITNWHTEIKILRLEREEEEKKLRILDTQFDRQTEKGVFSEIDQKNLKRINNTKLKVNHNLIKIINKEEKLAKKIIEFRSLSTT